MGPYFEGGSKLHYNGFYKDPEIEAHTTRSTLETGGQIRDEP